MMYITYDYSPYVFEQPKMKNMVYKFPNLGSNNAQFMFF